MGEDVVAELFAGQRPATRRTGVLRNAAEIAIGEQPLRQGGEGDDPHALGIAGLHQAGFDPAVEHVVQRLVNQQRGAELTGNTSGLPRLVVRVGRDPDVERLSGADRVVEGRDGLLQGGVRVEAVRVEDVDVVQAHAPQRLVEGGEKVLPRPTALPVGSWPHLVAGFGGDHQLVAERGEVLVEDGPEVDLRLAVGRAVVVGQVEVRDARVEGATDDLALHPKGLVIAEVLPEAEREGRQQQARASAAAVGHATVVAVRVRHIRGVHGPILPAAARRREAAHHVL